MSFPTLARVRTPKYIDDYWSGSQWVRSAVAGAAAHLATAPVVLPLTRLSGSLVFPVLESSQVKQEFGQLDVIMVSVSPPRRALTDLLQLRAYGHCIVLLSPGYRRQFFDLAELDLRGIGVSQARADGLVEQLIQSEGRPASSQMAPWWREQREQQLRILATHH